MLRRHRLAGGNMALSVFDLFKIGIGPSSSHTVGPMKAARTFVVDLATTGMLNTVAKVEVELFGSLAATGKGHGSDVAIMLGLLGEQPETVDTESVAERIAAIRTSERIALNGLKEVFFDAKTIVFQRRTLPQHPNAMLFRALDAQGVVLAERQFYSVGGGFVIEEAAGEVTVGADGMKSLFGTASAQEFSSAAELLAHCAERNLRISDVMLTNEAAWRPEDETRAGLLNIWRVMEDCVQRGCSHEGIMPGGMKVRRRAADLHRQLTARPEAALRDPLNVLDWIGLYALAVNEENASGGRVVTAPTNGAAGIIPAVLHYYTRFLQGADDDGVVRFMLTAGAIAMLYKRNASISGAEVGCQGEVGVACSMAAGALAEVMGGTPRQVENAAEIGMEHHLGLTCDPVGGLVQIPCIERNAMASVTAIQAARLALRGDGSHFVSLDRVIKTMRDTGADMKTKYKETARGGLAVNVVEC
jgi:L-serine dehydratase